MLPTSFSRSIIPNWNSLMDSFFDDALLPNARTLSVPATNVSEEESSYNITLAAPGLKKEDFVVKVENNVLTISSEQEQTGQSQEDKFTRKEYSYSSFERSFALPENAKHEDIEANYENGELKLIIPKKVTTVSQAKLIEVA